MESRLAPSEFESLEQKRAAEDPKYLTIASRLRELFWDSSCNDVTVRFYERLQNEAIIHGPVVRRHIQSVAASAQTANQPVRYFAAAITRRLREQGYLQDAGQELGL